MTSPTYRSSQSFQKGTTGPTGGWAGQSNGAPKHVGGKPSQSLLDFRRGLREVIFGTPANS